MSPVIILDALYHYLGKSLCQCVDWYLQLALLYMKLDVRILTSRNDTFGNISVYHSNVIQSSYKLYDIISPKHWFVFDTINVMLALMYAASLSTCTYRKSCARGRHVPCAYLRQIVSYTAKQPRVSASPLLPFWTYYMSSAHSITMPCTCMNNTSCNKLKVVPEPEIPVPRGKEWQSGVETLELLVV